MNQIDMMFRAQSLYRNARWLRRIVRFARGRTVNHEQIQPFLAEELEQVTHLIFADMVPSGDLRCRPPLIPCQEYLRALSEGFRSILDYLLKLFFFFGWE